MTPTFGRAEPQAAPAAGGPDATESASPAGVDPLAAMTLGHRDFALGRYAEAERWIRQAAAGQRRHDLQEIGYGQIGRGHRACFC